MPFISIKYTPYIKYKKKLVCMKNALQTISWGCSLLVSEFRMFNILWDKF